MIHCARAGNYCFSSFLSMQYLFKLQNKLIKISFPITNDKGMHGHCTVFPNLEGRAGKCCVISLLDV